MNSIREIIKEHAKKNNIRMKDVAVKLQMTDQGLNRAFRTKSLKLTQLEEIAELLSCTVIELIPREETDQSIHNVSEGSEVFQNSIAKNNFFSGDKTEIVRLQTENEFLKSTVKRLDKMIERQDKMIEKQDDEILFLREQMRSK